MKNSVFVFCFALVLLLLQSFTTFFKPQYFELKEGEKVNFNHFSENKSKHFSANFKRGSHDNTKYEIVFDISSNLLIKKLQSCPQINQSELRILYSEGSISRNKDTINIEIKTSKSKWFLFPINKQATIDSFSPMVLIKILSEDLNENICRNLITIDENIEIVALPVGYDLKEIYKSKHKKNSVGIFSYFKIQDSNGKSKLYSQGDYFLIGANSYKYID